MGQVGGIIIGAALIALAIMVTNHWQLLPNGTNGLAATIRLNRWTGAIDVCALNKNSPTGSNAAGLLLTCTPQ
jgi:hypothetical protein